MRVTGFGNSSNASATDPNFFTITHAGPGTLLQVSIDVGHAGLTFDSTSETGFPFTLGRLVNISPDSIRTNARPGIPGFQQLIINFAPGAFTSASSVSFGIDRDFIGDGAGNQADVLAGAEVNAITARGRLVGTFRNQFGFG